MAGAKLTDDNPSIFDLSDPHRPTKLAEMFSSLYDDEWTNAFETLRNQFSLDETEAIQHLLSVVTVMTFAANTGPSFLAYCPCVGV